MPRVRQLLVVLSILILGSLSQARAQDTKRFFEVDDVKAAFKEINGGPPEESAFRMDKFGSVSYRVFFVVAPDGLCYMLGERQE